MCSEGCLEIKIHALSFAVFAINKRSDSYLSSVTYFNSETSLRKNLLCLHLDCLNRQTICMSVLFIRKDCYGLTSGS